MLPVVMTSLNLLPGHSHNGTEGSSERDPSLFARERSQVRLGPSAAAIPHEPTQLGQARRVT